jgi:hypothetical protein
MWRAVTLLALTLCAGVVMGMAASVTLSTSHLGSNSTATPRCTTSGLLLVQNLSGTSVASVTVGGIPASCGSATMYATVNNGATNSSGSAAIPAGGGTVTVTLAAAVPATTVDQADIVVVGP